MLPSLPPLPPAARPSFGLVRATGAQAAQKTDAQAPSPTLPPVGAQLPTAGGPAPLPDPCGPQARDREVRAAITTLSHDLDSSVYMAYALMQRVAAMSQATQSTLLREAQAAVNAARRQEAGHTLDQVLGQNTSARINALGMGTFAVVNIVGVCLGYNFDKPFVGQMASQATQIAQPFINVADRQLAGLGGSHRANVAGLKLKDDAMNIQAGTLAIEAVRAAKETNQDKLRQVSDFLERHLQSKNESLGRMAH